MTDTTRTAEQRQEDTLGALIAAASRDLSTLVRSEIELAKAEIKVDVRNGALGGAMFAVAAFLGLFALLMLLVAAAEGLVALGLPRSLSYLIVAVALLLVAGVLGLVGKAAFARLGPPERTIRTSKETAAFLKKPTSARPDDAPASTG